MKISDCYEHIQKIEDTEKYIKAFCMHSIVMGIFTEKEMTGYEFITYSEEDLLKNCKFLISRCEEFKKIIEDKIKQLENEE